MKAIFGPVPSRRLGRSLGIDVIPPKTCTFDCVYCESGPTTCLTLKRKAFISPDEVLVSLELHFRQYPDSADVLTFSSAGEPTLYEPLGDLLRSIKRRYPSLPLIVLTNGSLLWEPAVRKDLSVADRVVPSLDAVDEATFLKINRPHAQLDLSLILEGLYAFRREYHGQLYLEIMLVHGCNDQLDHLMRIRKIVDRLRPDRIELNTVVRPPAYPDISGLSAEEMERASSFFPADKTQIIGKFQGSCSPGEKKDLDRRVVELVRRRPCTVAEMAASLGVAVDDINGILGDLERKKYLVRYAFNGLEYMRLGEEAKG
ncbi:MAG: radical SAM protein [Syntrophobacteraceae bacterium]